MPKMDKTGPDGLGKGTGRMLGGCRQVDKKTGGKGVLGEGMGRKHHSDDGTCSGKGKRLRYFEK